MAQSSINSSELISTVNELAKERRVNKDVLFSAIEAALISAYKKNYGKGANVRASIDRDKGEIDFDHVVIETTGVANPGPVCQTFFMDDAVAPFFRLDGVVTIVDAKHGDQTLNDQEVAKDQVAFADRIFISKRDLVTDEEYDIMMGMKLRGNTEAELRALYTGSDWAGTLYDMCRKGFLLKIYDGAEPTYDLAPMLPGWFEFPLSTGEDSDTIQKASELFTSAINMVTTLNVEPLRTGYAAMNNLKKLQGDKGHMEVALPLEGKAAGKVVHVDRKLSNDTTSVVPSYQLEAYLDSLPDDAPISVMHCFCRNIRRREGLQPKNPTPDEVCLCVGNIAKQIIEYGVGRQVSKAEARQILVDCEKKGCVHQVFHYACNMDEETTAICNCDTQCCEMLGSYTRGGMQPLYMRAHAKPVIVHPENCNGCNICNHFCPTVATGFNAQSGKVFVEYQRCIGCGVCVTKCPKDVRKMVDGDRVLFCKPLKKDLVRERNVRRQPKKK